MNKKLTIKSVISLKPNVAVRIEHNFNNGTVILIDTDKEILWFGNLGTLSLIKQLKHNRKKTISDIFIEVLSNYSEINHATVLASLNNIINDLYEKELIIIR